MTILFPSGNLQAKAGSMFDKVVASMGLTEYAKLFGPCLDLLKFFFVFFMCQENMGKLDLEIDSKCVAYKSSLCLSKRQR